MSLKVSECGCEETECMLACVRVRLLVNVVVYFSGIYHQGPPWLINYSALKSFLFPLLSNATMTSLAPPPPPSLYFPPPCSYFVSRSTEVGLRIGLVIMRTLTSRSFVFIHSAKSTSRLSKSFPLKTEWYAKKQKKKTVSIHLNSVECKLFVLIFFYEKSQGNSNIRDQEKNRIRLLLDIPCVGSWKSQSWLAS